MNKTKEAQDFIDSGVLDLYALGQASPEEELAVHQMCTLYPEVARELDDISIALEAYASEHAVAAHPATKPFVMASLNYMARLEAGEIPSAPPLLHDGAKISDYQEWLDRPDLQLKHDLEDAYAYIIGHTPQAITAIVWLSKGAMPEMHHDEHEKFLVVSGSCCINIEGVEHQLQAGSCISIPLHADHFIQVTSEEACKVILQRIAIAA